jgi:hypothetical protein
VKNGGNFGLMAGFSVDFIIMIHSTVPRFFWSTSLATYMGIRSFTTGRVPTGLSMKGICLLGLAIGDGRIGHVVAGGGGTGSGARDSASSHIGVVLVPMRAGSPAQVCRGLLDIPSDAIPPVCHKSPPDPFFQGGRGQRRQSDEARNDQDGAGISISRRLPHAHHGRSLRCAGFRVLDWWWG